MHVYSVQSMRRVEGWMHVYSLQRMRRFEGWMHVYSLQRMRRVEWMDAYVQLADNAQG